MFLQLFFGVNSEFFCKNIDFSKEDIRLCRKTKKVNPLLAGGCAALPHQSFRFSTDLAYRNMRKIATVRKKKIGTKFAVR